MPWVAELAEGRLEHQDDLYLTLSTVVRRAVYEGIGLAFAAKGAADAPTTYEPRSARYRQAFGLDDAPEPDRPPTEDELSAKRLARHRRNPGLDSLASFMKKPRR